METFTPTDKHKKAIELFELAGYEIKMGTKTIGNSVTFQILKDDKLKVGVSSSNLLTPEFAMRQIQRFSYKNGYDGGFKKAQENMREALGI